MRLSRQERRGREQEQDGVGWATAGDKQAGRAEGGGAAEYILAGLGGGGGEWDGAREKEEEGERGGHPLTQGKVPMSHARFFPPGLGPYGKRWRSST